MSKLVITKAISATKFEVELRKDTDPVLENISDCFVAHDYVSITSRSSIESDVDLSSLGHGGNFLCIKNNVHIGIFDFVSKYLPYLNNNPYLQVEHAVKPGLSGRPNYGYNDAYFRLGKEYYTRKEGEYDYKVQTYNERKNELESLKNEREKLEINTLTSILHALNQIPLKEGVGKNGESSYELASKLENILKTLKD